ncbi:hypothetical protein DEU56DRAFT_918699 [Suillus clintonianus]|uniref:uncharacterized protein n=1 Tax=Suillus clintonianus TaxID=1904413 RepID=UPI001B875160|nr:uncharacterized protein DEU56DRAFT_918699 [Suillus clintonianus]KAG2119189.1 hypothetical protein DEU56DRAFT_918699 [Suillus clintonianus]
MARCSRAQDLSYKEMCCFSRTAGSSFDPPDVPTALSAPIELPVTHTDHTSPIQTTQLPGVEEYYDDSDPYEDFFKSSPPPDDAQPSSARRLWNTISRHRHRPPAVQSTPQSLHEHRSLWDRTRSLLKSAGKFTGSIRETNVTDSTSATVAPTTQRPEVVSVSAVRGFQGYVAMPRKTKKKLPVKASDASGQPDAQHVQASGGQASQSHVHYTDDSDSIQGRWNKVLNKAQSSGRRAEFQAVSSLFVLSRELISELWSTSPFRFHLWREFPPSTVEGIESYYAAIAMQSTSCRAVDCVLNEEIDITIGTHVLVRPGARFGRW